MTKKLNDFIDRQRRRFPIGSGNVFAFSFSKVSRHWRFLEIIQQRHDQASSSLAANFQAFRETVARGTGTLTPQQTAMLGAASALTDTVHLEIETFYLFAKILLDEVAHAIEYYFGPARNLSLRSHDKLSKSVLEYARVKDLKLPDGLEIAIAELKSRVSDFRDFQIAHETSPRTMRGTISYPHGDARVVTHKIYPTEKDRQVESESLQSLKHALESYIELVIALIEDNEEKLHLRQAPTP
jgi:hypothetical protein